MGIMHRVTAGHRELAIVRKIGARGLRAIVEEFMLEIMYKLPSLPNVKEVVITREVVERKVDPISLMDQQQDVS